jgi:hypothetical protein
MGADLPIAVSDWWVVFGASMQAGLRVTRIGFELETYLKT